ncbi:MAG: MoaD/ThiS family protein [Gemmatimonadaceae bacterium]|nr:MoaD/ThiS family protein [Gemmatimonadaceae bacterium]
MRASLLLFASYADAFGARQLDLELPAGATVADVLATIASRPGAGTLPAAPLVAVNERYATSSTIIAAGDEIALIPPVAGG